jgi:gliding motility-associated-like protein
MKRILTLLITLFLIKTSFAQVDLSVTAINAPVSSCAMTATETVNIRIFNFGANLTAGTSFNVSYTINAGGPVTELVTLGSNLLMNSTLNYAFTTPANLSVAGTYTFTATASIIGDINASNNTFTGYTVTNTASSVGGTIGGGGPVCISGNSGVLTLSGHTGTVLRWEYSVDAGVTWINISNSTTTQSYSNLTIPTQYRAVVQNGSCATATSSIAFMTIDPATVGGSVTGTTSVCTGANSGVMTSIGRTGSIIRWEFSIDGGVTWTNIANTTSNQTYLNLTTTTMYRVRSQSGTCSAAYSSAATITVRPNSIGGTITPDTTTVCSGTNAGTLTLASHTGSIIRWEFSVNNGITWTNLVNVTTTQTYTNLVASRWYRVRIQSSPCSATYSDTAVINVTTVTVGGTISPALTAACSGANSGTLTLGGQNGAIMQWESSIDGGITWTVIANTTNTESFVNLTQSTMYRALVQNGGCTASYSSIATVNISVPTVGGSISGGLTVCSGNNAGVLTLSGQTGSVTSWEFSNDGILWSSISNTSATEAFTNLTDTTYYRSIVQSGVCPADTSTVDTVIVDPVTVPGIISPASSTVCSGLNTDTLRLTGFTGSVVQWEYSTDNGVTWITISNTAPNQAFNNLTTATIYRALVMSGVCSAAYSAQATISINPQAVGGTLYSDATVCGGSNAGTLTLVGHSGNISMWESSIDGGLTWSTISNTTFSNPYTNLTDTTMYHVIVNSGVCPTDTSNNITIFVQSPSVGGLLSSSATVCGGFNSGTITLDGETGVVTGWEYSSDGGVTWLSIANTDTAQGYLNLATTTMYRVRVTNGVCPSVTSDTATITATPAVVPGTISGSTTVCEGTSTGVLTLVGYTGTILGWESSTDGITWSTIPNATATENWSNPSDTTYYHVLVAGGACPMDTSAIGTISIYPKPVAGFSSSIVCLGNVTAFTDTTTVASGAISFHNWDFGDNDASVATNPMHNYGTAGTFNVSMIVISNNNCSDTAFGTVTVNALPDANITASGSLTICIGDSVQLSVPSMPQNDYLWSTGDTVNAVYASTSGHYVVTVTDAITGCTSADSVDTDVLPSPVANAGLDTTVSAGFSVTLLGNGGSFYSWSPTVGLSDPNNANPLCTPPYTVTYTLTVTDLNGCSDTDAVSVTLVQDYNVVVSNLITANGDGFNDVWNVQNIEFYPNNKVSIYNRNGMLVYEQEGYNNSWKGTYNGEQLPDGTYYYVLTFTDTDTTVKGAVTIVSEKK